MILEKLLFSIILLIGIYLWNKIIIEYLIVGLFVKLFSKIKETDYRIKSFIQNKDKTVKIFSGFYWFGGLMVLYGIWFGNIVTGYYKN